MFFDAFFIKYKVNTQLGHTPLKVLGVHRRLSTQSFLHGTYKLDVRYLKLS